MSKPKPVKPWRFRRGPKFLPPPGKVHRDKSKYTRKEKHKGRED